MNNTIDQRHPKIPNESLYWAKLDVSVLPKRHRGSPEQLGYLFESVLPIPIEDVQATYLHGVGSGVDSGGGSGGDGFVIACGIQREILDRHPQLESALTLSPPTLPEFLGTSLDASRFNLLTGLYEPAPVRRQRRQVLRHAILLLMAITIVIAFGLERRLRHVQNEMESVSVQRRQAQTDALANASGDASGGRISAQPLELRFVAALRTLRRTRQQGLAEGVTIDATDSIEALLRQWPSHDPPDVPDAPDTTAPLYVQTRSISSGPSSLLLRVGAPTSEDVSRLADSLRAVEGWKLQQPEIHRARDSVEATFRFLPFAAGSESTSSERRAP